MIDVFPFLGYPVAVLGLGRSGLITARALHASGAEVWAWDDDSERRAAAAAEQIPIIDLGQVDFKETSTLVLSPGIAHTHPHPHPVCARARAAGCEIIGDIELLARAQRDAGFIGITGTNGKSTTTALIGHIMRMGGLEVEIGGNFGPPALGLDALSEGHHYVLEMSSYQLELVFSITFDIAVLLNISADHLERHGGMDGYIAAKKLIFHRQTSPRTAVIGMDDTACVSVYRQLVAADKQKVIPVSGFTAQPKGVWVDEQGWLIDDIEDQAVRVFHLARAAHLPGRHNWQNAAAAYASCRAAHMQAPVVVAALNSYPGLAHRQEVVGRVDDIVFINDSKATNADAAARALACYDRVYWIAGGQMKRGGITALEAWFPRISEAFLFGDCAEIFAAQLGGSVKYSLYKTLDQAVFAAHQAAIRAKANMAQSKPTILFSPAAASFDQFSNFEQRGDRFIELVHALPGDFTDPTDLET